MSVLDRYLTRKCLLAIATVVTVLAALTLLFALIEELDEENTGYGFAQALEYLLLTMPRRIEELLSYAVFIGLLLALGNLSEGGELTAMRAAGVSPKRLIIGLIPTLATCLLLSFLLSEFLSPSGERIGEQRKRGAMLQLETDRASWQDQDPQTITPSTGVWLRRVVVEGSEYAHIASIDNEGRLRQIYLYEVDDAQRLVTTRQASTGYFDLQLNHWVLERVSSTELLGSSSRSSASDTWIWANPVNPQQIATQAFSDPRKMTMRQIWVYLSRSELHRIASVPFEISFWQKAMAPLTYISMALMALAVVIGPLRHTSIGQRLTMGLFIGLGFKYLQDLFAPMATVFHLPSILAVAIPALIYLAVAQRLIQRNA